MAESYRKDVVLHCVDTALSMESVLVTKTATMTQGSILKADGTEAAAADAATAVGVIDDKQFAEFAADGEQHLVNVVKRNAIVNGKAIAFSDAAYAGESLDAMVGIVVRDAESDFSRLV